MNVYLWSLPHGTPMVTLSGLPYRGAFNLHGKVMADGFKDHTVRLWTLPEERPLKVLQGHKMTVTHLAFNPDGKVLATSSWDDTVRLWSLPDGKTLRILEGQNHMGPSLTFSPNGQVLAIHDTKDTVQLWITGLARLGHLPVGQTTLEDLNWAQQLLQTAELFESDRVWLEFIVALMRWRRRFDIQLGEAPRHIEVGEFDIELEG